MDLKDRSRRNNLRKQGNKEDEINFLRNCTRLNKETKICIFEDFFQEAMQICEENWK